jgi:ATP-dependent RNA helicase RhlE
MRFDKFKISDEIKRNLEEIGFFRTTDIQFKTIPAIMNGEDVLAIAQTGTGKTAAFAIPVINHIQLNRNRIKGIKCLVMVPTRELAKQIGGVFAKICKKTGVTSYAVYGGVEQDRQIQQLAGGIDILIATPGRMFDLISQGHIDVKPVEILILDEADRMFDLGFIGDIDSIKRKLRHSHQTLFFSATINPEIKKMAYSQVNQNALRIQVSPEKLVSRNVTHYVAKVAMDEKRHVLVNFLRANPEAKSIVFVRTKVRAERVLAHLAKNEIAAVSIHGGMPQHIREENLELFRDQKAGVLIASDVSARGVDISGITLVINYDIPDDPENYVHRVGRTGRGFAKGEAISFCSPEEAEKLASVENLIQTKIPEIELQQEAFKDTVKKELDSMTVAEMLASEEALYESSKRKKGKKSDGKRRLHQLS